MSIRPAALFVIPAVLLAGPMTAAAAQAPSGQSDRRASDVAIGARVSLLGFGAEVSKLLTSHVGVRVGGNLFSYTIQGEEQDNITYDGKAKWQSLSALLDLYPSPRGSFHLTGGLVTNPVKATVTGRPTGGSFEINDNSYTAAEVGTLTGTGEFSSVMPYVGLGVGTAASNHGGFGFVFDLGVAIGKPTLSLTATGAANNAQLQSDLNAQIATTQQDLDKVPVYPVLSLGVIYRF